jgi:TPR repeat protein
LKELPPSGGAARTTASAERLRLTTAEIDSLIARGDALLSRGDFISARLFYERAADAGEGQAALRMGESYDPAFLARSRVAGFRGDALLAARWYLRALELGTPGAEILFKAVAADNGSSAR